MNFDNVMDRVATIIEKNIGKMPYDKNIAEALGMSAPQYANCKKRNAVPMINVANFCKDNYVTINWVLFAQSSPRLSKNDEEIFHIKRLKDINASGGYGAENYCEACEYMAIDKTTASYIGITNTDSMEAINIIGDSMEPTLKDNSIIILDRSKTTLVNSGIFVIRTSGGLFVKRLALSPKGGVALISDNKNYPTSDISFNEVTIVGKVVGSLERI